MYILTYEKSEVGDLVGETRDLYIYRTAGEHSLKKIFKKGIAFFDSATECLEVVDEIIGAYQEKRRENKKTKTAHATTCAVRRPAKIFAYKTARRRGKKKMIDIEKNIKVVTLDSGDSVTLHIDNGFDVFRAALSWEGLEKLNKEIEQQILKHRETEE